jgi:hypothetical protein
MLPFVPLPLFPPGFRPFMFLHNPRYQTSGVEDVLGYCVPRLLLNTNSASGIPQLCNRIPKTFFVMGRQETRNNKLCFRLSKTQCRSSNALCVSLLKVAKWVKRVKVHVMENTLNIGTSHWKPVLGIKYARCAGHELPHEKQQPFLWKLRTVFRYTVRWSSSKPSAYPARSLAWFSSCQLPITRKTAFTESPRQRLRPTQITYFFHC